MKTKFTPGPWRATAKRVTAPETEDRLALDVQINGGNAADNKANARLIAAAPDLLAALQDIIGWFPGRSAWHTDEPIKAAEKARAAIAKATGAQS